MGRIAIVASFCVIAWIRHYTPITIKTTGTHKQGMELGYVSPGVRRTTVRQMLTRYIMDAKVDGDFVETGVYVGNSSAVVAKEMLNRNDMRHMWLYDSWQGMPQTQEVDGQEASAYVGWGREASMEGVQIRLQKLGVNVERDVTFRKGFFNATFNVSPMPSKIAFLHVDSDWYDSVMHTMETFYHLVVPGGVILFDDFGWWEGSRVAFYEFCFKHGEYPLLERNAHAQAWWIKGKEHTRGSRMMSND
jgi:O-methyltransferase